MASNADIFKKYGLTEDGKRQTAGAPSAASSNAAILAKYGLTSTGARPSAAASTPDTATHQQALATERADELDKLLVPSVSRQAAQQSSMPGRGVVGHSGSGSPRSVADQLAMREQSRGDSSLSQRIENTISGAGKLYARQNVGVGEWLSDVETEYRAAKEAAGLPTVNRKEGYAGSVWGGDNFTAEDARAQAEKIKAIGNRLGQSGMADVEKAKQGLGKAGQFAVDLGVGAAQMGADVGLGLLTGGGAMLPMLTRSFGSGVQQAREKGYDLKQQTALGLANAATEYFSEKLFGGNPAYDKDVGLVNKALNKAITKYVGPDEAAKLMRVLSSPVAETLNEGWEEVVSDFLNPKWEQLFTGAVDERTKEEKLQQYAESWASGVLLGVIGQGGQAISKSFTGAEEPKYLKTAKELYGFEPEGYAGKATAAAPDESLTAAQTEGVETQKTASDEAGIQYSYIAADDAAAKKTAESSAYSRVVERGGGVTISDELLAKYDAINKNPAVKLITAVKDFYESHLAGEKVSVQLNNGVIEVKFENDGKKKAVGWRMKPDKAASFEKLLDLTRNAEYAYSELNRDTNEATSVPRFHYYIGDALVGAHIDEGGSVIGGIHMPVKIQVRDLVTDVGVQESRYYTHNLEKSKAGSDSPVAGADGANIDSNAYTPASADSISTPSQNVNREIEEPLRLKTAKEMYGFEPEGYEDTTDADKAATAAPAEGGLTTAQTEGAEAQKTASDEAGAKGSMGDKDLQRSMISYSDRAAQSSAVNAAMQQQVDRGKVVSVTSDEINVHKAGTDWSVVEKARKWLKDAVTAFMGDSVYFEMNGGRLEAYLTSTAREHFNLSPSPEKAAAINRFSELIQNAAYAYSSEHDTHSKEGHDVQANIWDYFVCPVDFGAGPEPFTFCVRSIDSDKRAQIYSMIMQNKRGSLPRNGSQGTLSSQFSIYGGLPASRQQNITNPQNVKSEYDAMRLKTAKELYGFEPEGYEDTADAGKATQATTAEGSLTLQTTEGVETQKTASGEAAKTAQVIEELGAKPSTPQTDLPADSLPGYGTQNAARQKQFYLAEQMARKFGAAMEVRELPNGVDGMYQNGTLVISPNAKNPAMTVAVHELTHHMENSGRYGDFSRMVLDYVANEMGVDVGALKSAIQTEYSEGGYTLDDAGAERELVAKFAESKLFQDEAAINRLARTNRTMLQTVKDWISDMVVKLTGTPEEKFFRNAERLYEKALREVGDVSNTNNGQAQYRLLGQNAFGDDVFETKQQLEGMTYTEKLKKFEENFYREDSPHYLGKHIRFQTNGGFYEAEIDRQTQNKNVGKINPGWLNQTDKAKINVGAAGDFVTLLEDSRLDRANNPLKKKNNDAKKGVVSMDYHLKNVVIDGKPFEVVINIRNKADGHFVYEVELRPNKKRLSTGPQITEIVGNRRRADGQAVHLNLDDSIDKNNPAVKPQDGHLPTAKEKFGIEPGEQSYGRSFDEIAEDIRPLPTTEEMAAQTEPQLTRESVPAKAQP